MNSPLRSSPQCYRSRVEMLTIICVDTYGQRGGLGSLSTVKDKKSVLTVRAKIRPVIRCSKIQGESIASTNT